MQGEPKFIFLDKHCEHFLPVNVDARVYTTLWNTGNTPEGHLTTPERWYAAARIGLQYIDRLISVWQLEKLLVFATIFASQLWLDYTLATDLYHPPVLKPSLLLCDRHDQVKVRLAFRDASEGDISQTMTASLQLPYKGEFFVIQSGFVHLPEGYCLDVPVNLTMLNITSGYI